MKKLLFFASIFLLTKSLLGNPIIIPQAVISEFRFDSVNKWEMEIAFIFPTFSHSKYDSICIGSTAGISRIRLDFVKDSIPLIVITPDSLLTPLSFNKNGDQIKLYSYVRFDTLLPAHLWTDSVSFGNYPGSMCDSIPTGFSICNILLSNDDQGINEVFCLCNSPTIGVANDTSGCCATLEGNLYDANHKKITSGNYILDYPLTFNPDGTYITKILARKLTFAGMYLPNYPPERSYYDLDTLDVDAYPDSVIHKDIQFVDYVGVKEKPVPPNPDLYIINYPNPFNPGTNFYIRMPDNLRLKKGRIEIYNSIGQKVFVIQLSNSSTYKWDGVDITGKIVGSGVYYYRLVFGNEAYKTGSMILLK